ncbi:hypothetical protein ABVT39_004062 [Epinephelus coioides]
MCQRPSLEKHPGSVLLKIGKRCLRQQEDPYHPPSPAAGCPQRRGAQQAAGRSDHRSGRRAAQHPGCSAAQEDREGRQVQVNLDTL